MLTLLKIFNFDVSTKKIQHTIANLMFNILLNLKAFVATERLKKTLKKPMIRHEA